MRKDEFLNLIDDIDDDLIEEAIQPGLHKKLWKKKVIQFSSAAACIVVVLTGSIFAIQMRDKGSYQEESTGNVSVKNGDGTLAENYQNNIYKGIGSGKFVYNNKTYHIVTNEEYLMSNSMPVQINKEDLGKNLANNISDTANNTIGNIYLLNYMPDDSMIALQNNDGSYSIAVEDDE